MAQNKNEPGRKNGIGRKTERDETPSVARRNFLKGATLAGAGALAAPLSAKAQGAAMPPKPAPSIPAAPNRQAERGTPPDLIGETQSSSGSDFMVDVMRGLGIEHVAAFCGSSFRGLHESLINYGMLTEPQLDLLSCMHEEVSVAMCHGYAKIEGKPMAAMMHDTVGLQHGSMAIYNAYADRVPIFLITPAAPDVRTRKSTVPFFHSVQDGAAIVRDFVKWDDKPGSLQHWGESATRAYKYAMTPPYGPVLLVTSSDMQEDPIPTEDEPAPIKPKPPKIAPPQVEDSALRDLAKMLVEAEAPVLACDRVARTPAGMQHLIELAELLQAPVVDGSMRMNFPWRHPLNQSSRGRAVISQADLILGMEMTDFWATTHSYVPHTEFSARSSVKQGAKVVSLTAVDLNFHSNYQDFQRYPDADLALEGDAEASLPSLIEACRGLIDQSKKSSFEQRGKKLADAHQKALTEQRGLAAIGWDSQPITVARMLAELYNVIKDEDWTYASGAQMQSQWPQKLWHADKHHRYIGDAGAYGIGYTAPATLGAAFANKKHGRLTVSVNGDGDLMCCPSSLWTAAHEKIPILYIVHNNRAWHQEIMALQVTANRMQRGIDRTHIGTTIRDPYIDYSKMAQSMGVFGQGPITDPKDLGPAIKKAVDVVKRGEPALIDVVAQGR
ncbi:MAG TPA: thiamine pyrophosphate-dependent enzyme [Stellaceae bacterium]|jgi:acetolactate synthase-1/2/3 large subunit|nr:thiamine pyrophosphate-dependent enzyme [Stellaceae bacterium]